MSLLVFIILIGFPAVGALPAWVVAFRSWRTAHGQFLPGSDVRETRGRLVPLLLLPATLVVFGLVVSTLLLGETIPDSVAEPAALAYGIPSLLTGMGMAIIYRRGIPAAVASREMFGRVMPLALVPETAAMFGLVVSFLLIGGGSNPAGVSPFGVDATWLASALVMVGGVGAPVGAWLASSTWNFQTKETWPKALTRSSRGCYITVGAFAIAMALLGGWFIVLLLVLYFGGVLALGGVLFIRIRRERLRRIAPK